MFVISMIYKWFKLILWRKNNVLYFMMFDDASSRLESTWLAQAQVHPQLPAHRWQLDVTRPCRKVCQGWWRLGSRGESMSASKRCRRRLSKRRLRWIEVHWVECVCCGSRSSDLLIADSTRFIMLPLALACFCISNYLVIWSSFLLAVTS